MFCLKSKPVHIKILERKNEAHIVKSSSRAQSMKRERKGEGKREGERANVSQRPISTVGRTKVRSSIFSRLRPKTRATRSIPGFLFGTTRTAGLISPRQEIAFPRKCRRKPCVHRPYVADCPLITALPTYRVCRRLSEKMHVERAQPLHPRYETSA